MIAEIIIAITGIIVLMLITPSIIEQDTIKTFEKKCTLDSLALYNITYQAVCPTEQITIHNWDSINGTDKTAIEFILSSNGYQLASTDIVHTEVVKDSMNNTEVVK